MKTTTAILLAALLGAGPALGDEQKPAKKPAAKSDKNVFQKAESSTGKFLRDNKIWTKSEPRGSLTNEKKPAKKKTD
jgi:hypothetical protein